jgi:hypothetical protein
MRDTIKLLSVTVLVGFALVGCVTAHSWEYRIRETKWLLDESALDKAGEVGWQLVAYERIPIIGWTTNGVVTTNWGYEYIFKRPKK